MYELIRNNTKIFLLSNVIFVICFFLFLFYITCNFRNNFKILKYLNSPVLIKKCAFHVCKNIIKFSIKFAFIVLL
jgi:hypothetical protein